MPTSILSFPDQRSIKFHDSLQLPTIFDPNLNSYKEWQHFNVFDRRLFLMLNFSLTGNIFSKRGIAAVSCIAGSTLGRLSYGVESQGTKDIRVSHLRPDVSFGKNAITFDDNEHIYLIHARLDTIGVTADLSFDIISQPVSAFARPFGSASIGWIAIPRLRVNGSMQIGRDMYHIKNGIGYHDHDWGYFNWGEAVGWEWGIFSENRKDGLTIVVDQRTSGIRNQVHSKVIYVYQGRKIVRIFSDKVEFVFNGNFIGKKETTPGTMRILFPYQSTLMPKTFVIKAKDSTFGSEKITIVFTPRRLIQFIVPDPNMQGETQLNQLLGDIKINLHIEGLNISGSLLGYFESVGPL